MKRPSEAVTATVCILLIAMSLTLPALAQPGPEIRVTDCQSRADQPDVAFDQTGNAHIVFFNRCGASEREIWYSMLDSEGNTLIDDTRLTANDGNPDTHPAVAVDSEGEVLIVFTDRATREIGFLKLDPGLDDQDGSAADPDAILVVGFTELTADVYNFLTHPRLALDSQDDVHVVFEQRENEVYYLKADNDGNVLIPTIHIRNCDSWYARPDLTLDTNDNVHIVWSDYEDTWGDEVYYMMLNGADGSVMIDATPVSLDDGRYSKYQSIQIDSAGNLHIVWHDFRSFTNEIYYSKLNPGLDDQNGDPANPAVITLIDDIVLSTDDDLQSRDSQTAIHNDSLFVSYYQQTEEGLDIFLTILDIDSSVVLPPIRLTTSGSVDHSTTFEDNAPNLDVDGEGRAQIVWCDGRHPGYEVYAISYRLSLESVAGMEKALPSAFSLDQNYPNPFNPGTTIAYDLMRPARVTLELFNLRGQPVGTLVEEWQGAGSYQVDFDAGDLPSGVYLYRLTADEFSQTKRMLLLK